MYDVLSDFMYYLNYSVLSFSDDTTIAQNFFFLNTFSWDLRLFSVLEE